MYDFQSPPSPPLIKVVVPVKFNPGQANNFDLGVEGGSVNEK
jgi:hypothetical protein